MRRGSVGRPRSRQVEAALRSDRSIRALMPVHLYGHPLDVRRLERIAAEHEILLIEDCAQSVGAERDGRVTGAASIACGTSLYPTKNLGAMGDGGIVLTADATVAEHARRLRNYGQSGKYEHEELGLNSRLDELHAAILRSAFMPHLEQWLARRRLIADHYVEALRGTSLRPVLPASGRSAHHLFPVEVIEGDPQAVAQSLSELGIGIGQPLSVRVPRPTRRARYLARPARALAGRPTNRRPRAVAANLPAHDRRRDRGRD